MIERELRSTLTRDSVHLEVPDGQADVPETTQVWKEHAHWSSTTTKRKGLACELLGELRRRSRSERRGHQRRRLLHVCM